MGSVPTATPTSAPTTPPSFAPTPNPTGAPTIAPTMKPTVTVPTHSPTKAPTAAPTSRDLCIGKPTTSGFIREIGGSNYTWWYDAATNKKHVVSTLDCSSCGNPCGAYTNVTTACFDSFTGGTPFGCDMLPGTTIMTTTTTTGSAGGFPWWGWLLLALLLLCCIALIAIGVIMSMRKSGSG